MLAELSVIESFGVSLALERPCSAPCRLPASPLRVGRGHGSTAGGGWSIDVASVRNLRRIADPARPSRPGDPAQAMVHARQRLPVGSGTWSASRRVHSAGMVAGASTNRRYRLLTGITL